MLRGLLRHNVDAELRAGFERSQCVGLLVDNRLVSTFDQDTAKWVFSVIGDIFEGQGVNSGRREGPCAVKG